VSAIARGVQGTNAAGKDLVIGGARSGAGAAGVAGGDNYRYCDDAGGNTSAYGGHAIMQGAGDVDSPDGPERGKTHVSHADDTIACLAKPGLVATRRRRNEQPEVTWICAASRRPNRA
jgi:hypothetical protein